MIVQKSFLVFQVKIPIYKSILTFDFVHMIKRLFPAH